MSRFEKSPTEIDPESGYLHIEKSVIRPFKDFVSEQDEASLREWGPWKSGGNVQKGVFPALDEALEAMRLAGKELKGKK